MYTYVPVNIASPLQTESSPQPQAVLVKVDFILIVSVWVLACMYVCVLRRLEDGFRSLGSLTYKQLWATVWVLEMDPGSFINSRYSCCWPSHPTQLWFAFNIISLTIRTDTENAFLTSFNKSLSQRPSSLGQSCPVHWSLAKLSIQKVPVHSVMVLPTRMSDSR